LVFSCAAGASHDWREVDEILQHGISIEAYPGCSALVANASGILYHKNFGNFTYGLPAPLDNNTNPFVDHETLWDMASCSKILGATTALAQFYQRGEFALNDRVMDLGLGSAFAANGKANITVLNCLLHNAGYPPDPKPNYWDTQFGCPETANYHPLENFSCQTKIFLSLQNQTLINPIGKVYLYSDLSFITLQYVVGYLARTKNYISKSDLYPGCDTGGPGTDQCYFEAYARIYVFQKLGMSKTGFLPAKKFQPDCSPTWNESKYYRHEQIQGVVSDGNAYALGGIAGHAGVFSRANPDLFAFMYKWLFPEKSPEFLNASTVKLWTTEYNHTQSSRALGWDTNDPSAPDYGWNQSCGHMSPKTFLHIGYTGTQFCGDPESGVLTVMLTNRVYPNVSGNYLVDYVEQLFNDAVLKVLGLKN